VCAFASTIFCPSLINLPREKKEGGEGKKAPPKKGKRTENTSLLSFSFKIQFVRGIKEKEGGRRENN